MSKLDIEQVYEFYQDDFLDELSVWIFEHILGKKTFFPDEWPCVVANLCYSYNLFHTVDMRKAFHCHEQYWDAVSSCEQGHVAGSTGKSGIGCFLWAHL